MGVLLFCVIEAHLIALHLQLCVLTTASSIQFRLCRVLWLCCMFCADLSSKTYVGIATAYGHMRHLCVQERDSVLVIVACVLHLGNIRFHQGDMDNAELLDERSHDALCTVADLLQVLLLLDSTRTLCILSLTAAFPHTCCVNVCSRLFGWHSSQPKQVL